MNKIVILVLALVAMAAANHSPKHGNVEGHHSEHVHEDAKEQAHQGDGGQQSPTEDHVHEGLTVVKRDVHEHGGHGGHEHGGHDEHEHGGHGGHEHGGHDEHEHGGYEHGKHGDHH